MKMKRLILFVFVCLFFADIITAQNTNYMGILLEKAVIEYYDTLSNASTYRSNRLQEFRRGELCDTNIYLYANNINIRLFLLNLQKPNKMPSKVFYHNGKHYLFMERTLTSNTVSWIYCRPPKVKKNKEVQVMEISDIDLISDTLIIRLTLCYLSKQRKLYGGKHLHDFGFAVSDGVEFEYVYSDIKRDWICIKRLFWGI